MRLPPFIVRPLARKASRNPMTPDAAALRGLRAYAVSLIQYGTRLRDRMDREIAKREAAR